MQNRQERDNLNGVTYHYMRSALDKIHRTWLLTIKPFEDQFIPAGSELLLDIRQNDIKRLRFLRQRIPLSR